MIVTASNTLAAGSSVLISGTTNYNGTYTVISATPAEFVIAAPFLGNDATGSWTALGGVIAGCTTTGATGSITLPDMASVPSRFTGVAPLAVFFDATDTTAAVAPTLAQAFHNLEYDWNFGDSLGSPVSGTTWSMGSRGGVSSRNAAKGPVAAHVFERPGLYTITLTVTDGTNTVTNGCVQVSVADPDILFPGDRTTCFSTTTDFTGCPTDATQVTTSNFATILNSATSGNTVRRLLLRRGHIFTAPTSARINATGPGIVGAFGPSGDPKPSVTANNTAILRLSGGGTPNLADWRVMDIRFDGLSGASSVGISASGGINQVTLLRMDIQDVANAIQFDLNISLANGHPVFDQISVVDTVIGPRMPSPNSLGFFIAAERLALLGNELQTYTSGASTTRLPYVGRGVISNNFFGGTSTGAHALYMHAPRPLFNPVFGGTQAFTEKVVISDNELQSGSADWTHYMGTQVANDVNFDERMRNVIIERNWYRSGTVTSVAMVNAVENLTIRNNICDMTNGGTGSDTCVALMRRNPNHTPNNQTVYHNTMHSNDSTSFFRIVSLDAFVTSTTIRNNLGSAPNATGSVVVVSGTGAGPLVQSNNFVTGSAGLVGPFTSPSGYRLTAGSGASIVNAGGVVPVFSDFLVAPILPRPSGAGRDLGAWESF